MSKREYQLKDGITKVHRSGLVLSEGETIEAYPDILNDHDDVLEPVDGEDDNEDSEESDE
ncbi:hypothetical protein [Natronoglomus mannanivorans]|uniref:Uncharacterized protein n=1 Tax=Natronoglomus mannanivorans TaxID=2979990 RepID=A0AAP2Z3P4_9EURY|nr:hypothetical protein [Halobacteria archaeon AArc-xg1-1]